MRCGRLLSPVHSLGPGDRVCLWTQGCAKRCPGCMSPDLQPVSGPDVDESMLAEAVCRVAHQGGCTGLTVSGGDPFEQPEALWRLLQAVRPHFEDILVYTGFTLQELEQGCAGKAGLRCLSLVDVLIDGRYLREQNTPDCVLRGSRNQVIHYLNPTMQPVYTAYMRQGRILESFTHNNTTIITGILNEEDVS